LANPKQIRDKIIDLLKSGDPKNADGKNIIKWFEGEPPPSRYSAFPFGWVEWVGGEMKAPVGSKAEITDRFYVVVIDKFVNPEKAEDSIMDFANSIEDTLDDFPTLGDLVATSFVINREKEKQFEGDYSMVGVRLTLYTRRRE